MKPTQRVILQVPIHKELKIEAETVAVESGFSSLQDAIRMFLAKFAKRQLVVSIEESLSSKAERRYTKMVKDIKKGKNVTKTKSLEELFSSLDA